MKDSLIMRLHLMLLFICIIYQPFFAQNFIPTDVEISSQKVIIEGKTYYLHTVKKGQTLYSIAKAYQCTVNEILQNNSSISEDIKIDQVIKIPLKPTNNQNNQNAEVIHTVLPGQTLFSISRMYGVSVDDIKLANNLSSDTLKVSQQLIIPFNNNLITKTNKDTTKENETNFILHRVKENETLFSLSKQYNVSIEKILELNPEHKETLKLGAELKIPIQKDFSCKTYIQVNCDTVNYNIVNKKISIALLLPFMANSNNIENSEEENQEENTPLQKNSSIYSSITMNFIEFYQGVLLAIEDLKKEGLNIELNVFDSEKDIERINQIILDPNFQKSQLIIGPVFPEQIKILADYASKNEKTMVIPVSPFDSTILQKPHIFQILSNRMSIFEKIVNTLKSDTIKNIKIVYNTKDPEKLNEQISNLAHKGLDSMNKKINEYYIYNYDFKELLTQLETNITNHIVCFSNDEVFVSALLGQLETRLLYYPIQIYGMIDWLSFQSIDLNYFYNQQLICYSNFWVNYHNTDVLSFLRKYRLRYSSEPIRNSRLGFNYSMLGYDVTNFFSKAITNFNTNYLMYNCVPYKPLNVKFNFIPFVNNAGYINHSFYYIRYYKNFDIKVE